MDLKEKKKRAQKIRDAILKESEPLGKKEDYGYGLSNFYKTYKVINGKGLSKIEIDFFKIATVLFVTILLIYFIIKIKDRNIENESYELYLPEEIYSTDTSEKRADDPLISFKSNKLESSHKKELPEVEMLIRLQEYKKALSRINNYIKKKSNISIEDKNTMRFYKMILLYNQGYKSKAREVLRSLQKERVNKILSLKISFYSKFIKK